MLGVLSGLESPLSLFIEFKHGIGHVHANWIVPNCHRNLLAAFKQEAMRPACVALLGALALMCSAHVAAVDYTRPVNGDCLQTGGAGTPAGAQLYPEQYMLVGDEQIQDGLSTQASAARQIRVLSERPWQPRQGKRQVGGHTGVCASSTWPLHLGLSVRSHARAHTLPFVRRSARQRRLPAQRHHPAQLAPLSGSCALLPVRIPASAM